MKPPAVIRTLSRESIEALLARIDKTTFKDTYRACQVTESTFRRGINGKSINESTWKQMTKVAKGEHLP